MTFPTAELPPPVADPRLGELFEIKVPSNESTPLDVPELQPEGEGGDPYLVVLCSLLAIALLTVCYFAGEIVLPIVLAFASLISRIASPSSMKPSFTALR